MRSCRSRGWKPGLRQRLRRRESGRGGSAPRSHFASAHSFGLRLSGVRGTFLYLQCNDFEFPAPNDLRAWSATFRTTKQLHRAERALGATSGAKNLDRDIFHHETRTLQPGVLAGHFVTRKKSLLDYAGHGPQLEVHSIDLNAAALRLFFGQFDDAHGDGKFVHVIPYSRAHGAPAR